MSELKPSELREVITDVFTGYGTPVEIAEKVSSSLVRSNLVGHDSHGASMVPIYAKKIEDGEIKPDATPTIRSQKGAVSSINCRRGFGHLGGLLGVKTVVNQAKEFGVATVALEEVNHVGRIGEYGELISEAGMVGLIIASGSGPGGSVAPFGGSKRVFGTNPICWSFPRIGQEYPFLLDMATSNIAWGKVSVSRNDNREVPKGALVDNNGRPSQNPNAFFEGGALLPFGQQKGGGLNFAIEIMATLFAGFAPAVSEDFKRGNPVILTAWNIENFTSRDRFDRLMKELCEHVKSTPPSQGFDGVILPGEIEFRTSREKKLTGITIPDNLWNQLKALSR